MFGEETCSLMCSPTQGMLIWKWNLWSSMRHLPIIVVAQTSSSRYFVVFSFQCSIGQVKIGVPQTKGYSYETVPWISSKCGIYVADSLLLLCAKFGDIWANGIWVMIYLKVKLSPPYRSQRPLVVGNLKHQVYWGGGILKLAYLERK